MKSLIKAFASLALCLLAGNTMQAQESNTDLSSQRAERPYINPVPGSPTIHNGLLINPTPQSMTHGGETIYIGEGFVVKDRRKTFADELSFIKRNKKGISLTIDFGARAASKKDVKQVSGAYSLEIDSKGVRITGYDEKGAFYGIQTLKQIISSPAVSGDYLPYLCINDYPSLPTRGVVEGFYGTPWSHETRLSLIDFFGDFKMNSYFYGPKDDPYHSSPNWRLPYPEDQARNISELIAACKANYVDFIWAIHPGQDIKWNEEDYNNLVGKFNAMYDLGVRAFAIFFDDISGEGARPENQIALLNRLTEEFVKAKGDVAPMIVCPTDYTQLWANPTDRGSLVKFGNTLNPEIRMLWTGEFVCSDITKETLDWVGSRIKRPALFWWNYPVTDYARHILVQGPAYGFDTDLTDDDLCGVLSNPMEYGEASKLAIYGVADYTWNVASYNPMDNWERGLKYLMPDAADAYRTFAIHSCDTETGYRKDESWETETFYLEEYTPEKAEELLDQFSTMTIAEEQILDGCTNERLLSELRPWLTEFTALAQRCHETTELMDKYHTEYNHLYFWDDYAANLMTEEEKESYSKHKVGTLKLQPYYEYAMQDMGKGFISSFTERYPCIAPDTAQTVSDSTLINAFDRKADTYYTLKGTLKVDIPEGCRQVVILMQPQSDSYIIARTYSQEYDEIPFQVCSIAPIVKENVSELEIVQLTGDVESVMIHEIFFLSEVVFNDPD